MSDVREMLDGIESTARRAPGMPPLWFYNRAIADVPRLVAALRAVLDLHPRVQDVDARDEPWERYYALDGWWCGNERCGVGTVEYPCETVRAITEALGGEV